MDADAAVIYAARSEFVEAFRPIFSALYARLCNAAAEAVDITYESHADRGPLGPLLREVASANKSLDTHSTVRTRTISIC